MSITPTTKVVAVVNRKNGARFNKDEVSTYLVDYAMQNRGDFLIVYEDEKAEPVNIPLPPPPAEVVDNSPRFTREELHRMTKNSLQELAGAHNLVYEGETKEALIDLLLKAQED